MIIQSNIGVQMELALLTLYGMVASPFINFSYRIGHIFSHCTDNYCYSVETNLKKISLFYPRKIITEKPAFIVSEIESEKCKKGSLMNLQTSRTITLEADKFMPFQPLSENSKCEINIEVLNQSTELKLVEVYKLENKDRPVIGKGDDFFIAKYEDRFKKTYEISSRQVTYLFSTDDKLSLAEDLLMKSQKNNLIWSEAIKDNYQICNTNRFISHRISFAPIESFKNLAAGLNDTFSTCIPVKFHDEKELKKALIFYPIQKI